MFEERILQFFCTDEQFAATVDTPPEFNLVSLPEKEWNEFEVACQVDWDCPRTDLGQVCLRYHWQMVQDGSSYMTGEACYNWESPVCPGSDFSAVNYNYANTEWSYFFQMRCKDQYIDISGASALFSAAALLLTALTVC